MKKLLGLSIIVPCYNEENNVKVFYDTIIAVINAESSKDKKSKDSKATSKSTLISSYEIIFVDDGSKDGTIDEIRKLQTYDKNVRIVKLSRNFGKEAAMLAGLKASKKELVTLMDCDLQDPPALLTQMLELYYNNTNLQMIIAKRKDRAGEGKIRAYFSEMFYKFNNLISRVKIQSGVRDFRLMTRNIVESIIKLNEYHRFSKAIFEFVGYQKEYLEYEYIQRNAGISKWSFWKLFTYGLGGIISFSTMPLRIITFIGIFIFLLSCIYGSYIMISTLIFGNEVKGYPSLIVLISFFGGLQIIMLGIIGEYIARIYEQSKNRPHYFVEYED